MSKLHQMNLQYHPVEDRVLLRISTSARAEYRFWMTRRYVQVLWPVLRRLLESDPTVRMQSDPSVQREVMSFQHEKALQETDRNTRYREDVVERPLGEAPLLLSRVRMREAPDGRKLLCLHDAGVRGIELALTPSLVHSLCQLLVETARKAGWDLDLRVVEGADRKAPPSAH